jgi:hypothetical protein
VSLESDFFTALTGLTSGRVYPDVAPLGAVRPYIIYQQVGGQAVSFLASAVVGKRNARMQVECYADTRIAAATLGRSIEDALVVSTAIRATPEGAMVSTYEGDTTPPLYGTRQLFSTWY